MQEHNLYYDGNTGCYYDYDKTTNKFVFHSQAYAETTAEPVAQNQSTKTGTDKSADTTSKKVVKAPPPKHLAIILKMICFPVQYRLTIVDISKLATYTNHVHPNQTRPADQPSTIYCGK